MSGRRVAAVVRRIANQFRRDHRTLGLMFAAPLVVMFLLGWVIRGQEAGVTRAVIANEVGSSASGIVAALTSAAGPDSEIEIVAEATSEAAGRNALVEGQADLVVAIVPGTSSDRPTIRLTTVGLNPGSEGTHVARLQAAFGRVIAELLPPVVAIPTIERATVYGSADADVLDSFAPVFVGYFAYFFTFLLTGISFLRERIGGTLERLLATPVTRAEIVLGYSVGFGIFATLQVAAVLLFTLMRVEVPAIGPLPSFVIGLDVPSAGSPLVAYLIALVLGLGAVSLGIFLSTFARTELQILQFIPVVIVPQGLLGGIFWPVEALPEVLQPVARVLPVTYAVEGLREVMIAGAGLTSPTVLLDLGVLAATAGFFVVLAAATIRREIA